MRHAFLFGSLAMILFLLAAYGGIAPAPAPAPAPENDRLDLGDGVVVMFVGISLPSGRPGEVAYVTHVPSGSQAVLDRSGQVIVRHDGLSDGPARLEAVLADPAAMERIMSGLERERPRDDLRSREFISWLPAVRFGGITYLARSSVTGHLTAQGESALNVEDLGAVLYRVAFRVAGFAGSNYSFQDGDATFLSPGTQVHAVKGYAPTFRLATLEVERVILYEADTNPLARAGGDLLDIQGRVDAIDILSEEDAETVLGTIGEEHVVEHLVGLVLESPVDQGNQDHQGPRYFLGFRLVDDTKVVRSFWLESGELSRGIMTDPFVTLAVWGTLPDEHLSAATDEGPRISERLAARLGLAYLSFSAPELDVTVKPHSPTVRLMRRSEFDAMQGGTAGTTLPDPLVWVVEAQGSWRTGGIVPEEAREDLSVGLVAFDADTGSTYGRSHRNEPLLERGNTP